MGFGFWVLVVGFGFVVRCEVWGDTKTQNPKPKTVSTHPDPHSMEVVGLRVHLHERQALEVETLQKRLDAVLLDLAADHHV